MRHGLLFFFCLLFLLFSGCTAMSPPESLMRDDPTESALITAEIENIDETEYKTTLYFRYVGTGMLAPQERAISVPKNTTREKALIQALLNGPGASAPQLAGVFQSGVSILSTHAVEGVLYVTFNDALLGGYNDEPQSLSSAFWQAEAPLRRSLAMSALVASLTESGEFQSVQVLIQGRTQVTTSMRLNRSYFMTGEDSLTGPQTRDETRLLTQANTARAILEAWQRADLGTLYLFTAAKDPETGVSRPSEQAAYAQLSQAGALIRFSVSPGNVSQSGQVVVLCADIDVRMPSGETASHAAWPVVLYRENGIWKIPYNKLTAMMAIPQ